MNSSGFSRMCRAAHIRNVTYLVEGWRVICVGVEGERGVFSRFAFQCECECFMFQCECSCFICGRFQSLDLVAHTHTHHTPTQR
jgi:hypothetical protein